MTEPPPVIYTLTQVRRRQQRQTISDEQEKYTTALRARESGPVETDAAAVVEWACELEREPLRCRIDGKGSSWLPERPPLSRTGYQSVPGNEGSCPLWVMYDLPCAAGYLAAAGRHVCSYALQALGEPPTS
uniref:Uncharacterized protein n=1 Tax=Thermogemmatispora argillosa TaxID=2045280 RepID=A0A455SZV3_9CHLR|nr:hypothetical protein KTA_08100 [Thermogemmatispora argillosa]